jgi:hypothetical protein
MELQDATITRLPLRPTWTTLTILEQIEHDFGGVRLVDQTGTKGQSTFLAFDIECTKPPA